jgi:alkaline phosphatase
MCSGIKTYNAAINVAIDSKQVQPLARDLQEQGFGVGVVTSVPISHATPAAAYANNVERDDYQDLTRDLLGLPSIAHPEVPLSGVDVLLGCGWGENRDDEFEKQGLNYVPGNRYLAENDLKQIDVENGGRYRVVQRTPGQSGQDLLSAAAEDAAQGNLRLFGFFGIGGAHLPYQTADGRFDPTRGQGSADRYTPEDLAENPSLADMTRAALQVLPGEKGRPFWLMIEAGDVDWANHNNNLDDSIGAVFSGDAAFQVVTEWVETHSNWDETLVIVTADHGHFLNVLQPEFLAEAGRLNRERISQAESDPADPKADDK